MLRKITGYTLATLSMLIIGVSLIVSIVTVAVYLFSSAEISPTLILSIFLLLLAIFKRPMFVRIVIRFEAFAHNMDIDEYITLIAEPLTNDVR